MRDRDEDDFTSEQLLDMLTKRYDSFVFIGVQPKTKNAGDLTFCTVGHMHECIGLAAMASRLMTLGGEGIRE